MFISLLDLLLNSFSLIYLHLLKGPKRSQTKWNSRKDTAFSGRFVSYLFLHRMDIFWGLLAPKTIPRLDKTLQQPTRSSNFCVFEANTRNKTDYTTRKTMKKWAIRRRVSLFSFGVYWLRSLRLFMKDVYCGDWGTRGQFIFGILLWKTMKRNHSFNAPCLLFESLEYEAF